MVESAKPAVEQAVLSLKFKAPASTEWRDLQPGGADEEQKTKAMAARDALKDTLLGSLQMQQVVVLAGSGTSLGPVGGPSVDCRYWDTGYRGSDVYRAENSLRSSDRQS